MSAISLRLQPALARAAARFAVVGLLGTLLDMSLFAALHLALGLPALPANALSYSAGILNNFLLHRRWTYANDGQRQVRKPFSLARAAARDGRPTGIVGQVSLPAARASENSPMLSYQHHRWNYAEDARGQTRKQFAKFDTGPNSDILKQFTKFAAGPNSDILKQFTKFAAGPNSDILKQFARFAAVSLTALALNTLIVILLAPTLQDFLPGALAALAAKACATAAGMAWNFLANHWWTFRDGA